MLKFSSYAGVFSVPWKSRTSASFNKHTYPNTLLLCRGLPCTTLSVQCADVCVLNDTATEKDLVAMCVCVYMYMYLQGMEGIILRDVFLIFGPPSLCM